MVPVRDRLRPGAVAVLVAEALGAPALSVGCAMAPSDGRSISSGWVLGAGVAPGAGLETEGACPVGVGSEVASRITVDGARPVVLGTGAELGYSLG